MAVRPGDVILVWDESAQKHKRHICICPERQHFLRINSRRPLFASTLPLLEKDCNFLDQDSYVDFVNLVRNSRKSIRDAELIGRLSKETAETIVAAAHRARTLTPAEKALIDDRLSGPDGPIQDP